MTGEMKNIPIPVEIYQAIQDQIDGSEFHSVEEYVTFVLEEVLKDDDDEDETPFTEEDEEEVKKRLRALGYLD